MSDEPGTQPLPPPWRLLIFGVAGNPGSSRCVEAFIEAARARSDVAVVALCDSGPVAPLRQPLFRIHAVLRHAAILLFNPWLRGRVDWPTGRNLEAVAAAHDLPLIVPPGRDVNHPTFVASLREDVQPHLTLSIGCPQRFGAALLQAVGRAVNLHDALLPDYKGVWATAWSLYAGAETTGYTYHWMVEGLDAGAVLLQRALPVPSDADHDGLLRRKTEMAAADAATVLDMMVAGAAGTPQRAGGSLVTRAMTARIRRIDDPGAVTAAELHRRLRAFGSLFVTIGGEALEVTVLRPARRAAERNAFTTQDGRRLVAHRCSHLPVPLYRLFRGLLGRRVNPRRRTARG
jgi:methionyl-tRNA formyltransferase